MPTGQRSYVSHANDSSHRFLVQRWMEHDSIAPACDRRNQRNPPACEQVRSLPFDRHVHRTCCTSWRRRLNFRTTSSSFFGSAMFRNRHRSTVVPLVSPSNPSLRALRRWPATPRASQPSLEGTGRDQDDGPFTWTTRKGEKGQHGARASHPMHTHGIRNRGTTSRCLLHEMQRIWRRARSPKMHMTAIWKHKAHDGPRVETPPKVDQPGCTGRVNWRIKEQGTTWSSNKQAI